MEIIITKSFKKDFLKILKAKSFIPNFIDTIQNKNHTFIELKIPYKKFKYKIGGISLRSIFLIHHNETIIPIIIAKKSDKNLGYNIVLDSNFNKILDKKVLNILNDIRNGDCDRY